jgi:hypothetical protein
MTTSNTSLPLSSLDRSAMCQDTLLEQRCRLRSNAALGLLENAAYALALNLQRPRHSPPMLSLALRVW